MMNIKRVKYKMRETDEWKVGYVVGAYDGANTTLLDENYEAVPKLFSNGEKFTAWSIVDDTKTPLNITIPV